MKRREITQADLQLSRNAKYPRIAFSDVKSQVSVPQKAASHSAFRSGLQASSLNSVSTSENYFSAQKPARRSERSKNFNDSAKKLAVLSGNVKKQADRAIISANKVANQTLNKRAEYQQIERYQPEMQLIDHFRHINQRVLNAEEQDVMLQCTPLYCEGTEYRRFLPDTIGRRAQPCKEDLQYAFLRMESERCITQAYKVLADRKREQDQLFEALIDSSLK